MKNSSIVHRLLSILFILTLLALSGCTRVASSPDKDGIKNFPESMVGTWLAPLGIGDVPTWQITFEKDGTISQINHIVFGLMVIKEGGIYYDGPDSGTYMVATLGPVETEYDADSETIKVKIVIDDYEMKLPTGTLAGHMFDTFVGSVSKDGRTWETENRNYGWLEGAKEPDIDWIDENPEKVVFTKYPEEALTE